MKKALLALMVVALAVPAVAQEVPCGVARAHEAVLQFLELTPDQVGAWDILLQARRDTVEPLRQQLRDIEQQLAALLAEPDPDPVAVGDLVIAGHDLRLQIRDAEDVYVTGFEALLDEQQAQKLHLIRAANRVQPLIPPFRLFGLAHPHPDQPPDDTPAE